MTTPDPIVQGEAPQSPSEQLPIYSALLALLSGVASGSPKSSCILTIAKHGDFKIEVTRPTEDDQKVVSNG